MQINFLTRNKNDNSGSYRIWVKDLSQTINDLDHNSKVYTSLNDIPQDTEILIICKSYYDIVSEARKKLLNCKIGVINIPANYNNKDIDFVTHPIFSKSYLLRGDNEAAIRGLFNNKLLNFIQSQQKISIEGSGDQLIFYRNKNRVKPEEVESFMEEGFQVFGQFLRST